MLHSLRLRGQVISQLGDCRFPDDEIRSNLVYADDDSAFPSFLNTVEDGAYGVEEEERTALQKILYPAQEEMPGNFEVSCACLSN